MYHVSNFLNASHKFIFLIKVSFDVKHTPESYTNEKLKLYTILENDFMEDTNTLSFLGYICISEKSMLYHICPFDHM